VYYTIELKGDEFREKAVNVTEKFFSLHLPSEDINSDAYRDFARFVATHTFFALVREADSRISSKFEERPEMIAVRDAAARAMANHPKWPELESLVLAIKPAKLHR
jgi:hypothetical protein